MVFNLATLTCAISHCIGEGCPSAEWRRCGLYQP